MYGAIAGAFLVNFAKTKFTGIFPEAWLFALGGLFVFVTLFLPKGIIGLFDRFSKKQNPNNESEITPEDSILEETTPKEEGKA